MSQGHTRSAAAGLPRKPYWLPPTFDTRSAAASLTRDFSEEAAPDLQDASDTPRVSPYVSLPDYIETSIEKSGIRIGLDTMDPLVSYTSCLLP